MTPFFVTSYVVLWLLVLLSFVLVLLLYRQYGLTLMPGRQRINLRGLDIGSEPPPLRLQTSNEDAFQLAWDGTALHRERDTKVAVFAEPHCPICGNLLEHRVDLAALAARWPRVDFYWIDEHTPDPDRLPDGWTIATSEDGEAVGRMQIPAFPFTYVVSSGRIASKGLVNTADDIEGLLQQVFGSHPQRKELAVDESLNGMRS